MTTPEQAREISKSLRDSWNPREEMAADVIDSLLEQLSYQSQAGSTYRDAILKDAEIDFRSSGNLK